MVQDAVLLILVVDACPCGAAGMPCPLCNRPVEGETPRPRHRIIPTTLIPRESTLGTTAASAEGAAAAAETG